MQVHTFSRSLSLSITLSLLIALTGLAPASTTLNNELSTVIDGGDAASAFWGLHVRDLETGDVLYDFNGTRRFVPASNQKILTAATALDALGSTYRYETGLYYTGEIDGDVLRGDLILKGSGDPSLGSSEMRAGDPLRSWARQLSAMGIKEIEGRLIGDDSVFDGRRYAEGWDVDYVMTQSSRLLGVSIGGLSYNDNLARLHIRAEGSGTTPEITTTPANVLEIRNESSTSPRRRGRAINVERLFGTETVVVSGSVPTNYRTTVLMPPLNPTMFTVKSLRRYMEDAGVNVDNLTPTDINDLDEAPEDYEDNPLFVHYSPPMSEILHLLNKKSNNFYADQVFRTYGWRGTADGAENRTMQLLRNAGANTNGMSIRDGSGLSRKNMISPAATTQLLVHMNDHREREAFRNSLPSGGEPETTLRYRLSNAPVEAKTGALEFSRALSGYATLQDGREVAFAFYVNNYEGPSYRVTQLLDRLVVTMTS